MTLLLTLVAAVLVVAIVTMVVWEARHRRSEIVRVWNPSTFPGRVSGGLGMLVGGDVSDRLPDGSPETIVILHGLDATADYFGDLYDGLARHRRLVLPDLLGFGRSIDEHRERFDLDDHVDALERGLASVGVAGSPVAIAAHSMGSAVALAYAARHPDEVVQVVLWAPPVFAAVGADGDPADPADQLGEHAAVMTRLSLMGTDWADRVCRWCCDHRRASGLLVASLSPRFPVPVSRRTVLHTWPAYATSIRSLVLDADWTSLFDVDVPVTVFRGTADPIGSVTALASVARGATIVEVEGADNHVAITHPNLLFDALGA